jgi:hypothetical protein
MQIPQLATLPDHFDGVVAINRGHICSACEIDVRHKGFAHLKWHTAICVHHFDLDNPGLTCAQCGATFFHRQYVYRDPTIQPQKLYCTTHFESGYEHGKRTSAKRRSFAKMAFRATGHLTLIAILVLLCMWHVGVFGN